MGLSLYAYPGPIVILRVYHPEDEGRVFEDIERDGEMFLYDNPDFPGRSGLPGSCYVEDRDPVADAHISYGGWSRFRADLLDGRPEFREIVEFSDCEGTIGGVALQRLATAFAQARSRIFPDPDCYDSWLVSFYDKVAELFMAAARTNGVVCFS